MTHTNQKTPAVLSSIRKYWMDQARRDGSLVATRGLFTTLWRFASNSTPSRLRQRFGDADYDWDFRVNTTSGAVGWRDRLLGEFHSPYQPTEPTLFREMLDSLQQSAKMEYSEFTFVDLGSGKGRTLLMASDYPFRGILGIEILPALHEIAQQNLAAYESDSQKCFVLESVCADATAFHLPDGPLVLYLFNPFPEAGLRLAVSNLGRSLAENPRPAYVLYHNPQLEHVLAENKRFHKIAGTHQYSIYSAQ
jgi:SAM-dependent methyltransferase